MTQDAAARSQSKVALRRFAGSREILPGPLESNAAGGEDVHVVGALAREPDVLLREEQCDVVAAADLSDVGGELFTNAAFALDIITPFSYSFSAGGPIVSPRHRCLLLTPVAPHMLFDRSLVLDADEEVAFTVTDGRAVVLTVDGRELGCLVTGDEVVCTAGAKSARIVTFGPRDFHQILKAKFGLEDR